MKNTQKGFIVPLLITIIAILVAGGGYYVYLHKNINSAALGNDSFASAKTFTHSSGAFSFEYPTDLIASEKNSEVIVSTNQDIPRPVFTVSYTSAGIFQSMGITSVPVFKTTTSKGYKVYVLNINQSGLNLSYQLISLDDSDNPSNFLVVSVVPNTVGFSDKDLESVLNSMSIDKTKVLTLINAINQSLEDTRNKGTDAMIKASLSNLRAEGALYYDGHNNSYTGLCSDKVFNAVDQNIKNSNFTVSCFASSQIWSASSPLKTTPSIGYCVDSTGFGGTTSSPTKGTSGKCN